jgi:hypothetical protein
MLEKTTSPFIDSDPTCKDEPVPSEKIVDADDNLVQCKANSDR